jgi:hypothetical protein
MSRGAANRRILPIVLAACTGAACAVNPPPAAEGPGAPETELTLGLVQREVKNGSTGDEVIRALGSPNQVTRDGHGREVWAYDRVASERIESVESGSLVGGVVGTSGNTTGAVGGHAGRKNTRERTSQKTLTVVVRFDAEQRVSAVTIHSTRF